MTRVQYYTASSLDGYIADPSHSLDWLFQFAAETSDYPDFIAKIGALAMGSSTYEWMLKNHVRAGSDSAQPWPYEVPTWVFSSRNLPALQNADVRFVQGDVRPAYEEMLAAAGGKHIWIVGGGDLVGQFYDARLLDEIHVALASVTLGAGAPLLPRAIITPPLRLLSATAWADEFVRITYEVVYPAATPGGQT